VDAIGLAGSGSEGTVCQVVVELVKGFLGKPRAGNRSTRGPRASGGYSFLSGVVLIDRFLHLEEIVLQHRLTRVDEALPILARCRSLRSVTMIDITIINSIIVKAAGWSGAYQSWYLVPSRAVAVERGVHVEHVLPAPVRGVRDRPGRARRPQSLPRVIGFDGDAAQELQLAPGGNRSETATPLDERWSRSAGYPSLPALMSSDAICCAFCRVLEFVDGGAHLAERPTEFGFAHAGGGHPGQRQSPRTRGIMMIAETTSSSTNV